MLQSIGFGWFILAAFLFINLLWCWDMAITPPPRAVRRKRATRPTKLMIRKVTKRTTHPMARLQRLSLNGPVAQSVP